MVVTPTDRMILHWAYRMGYEGDYDRASHAAQPCLRVVLREATVWFQNGRVNKVVARDGVRNVDRLVRELAAIFALCAVIEASQPKQTQSARHENPERSPSPAATTWRTRPRAQATRRATRAYDD